MKRPSKNSAGFSLLEMMIVLLIIATVSGYAVVTYMHTQANLARNEAALRFAIALEKAQQDSAKRRSSTPGQMAYVKIVDAKTYTLHTDANADGVIDAPVVTTLPNIHRLQIRGPFPKYFRFDWLGRVVDSESQVVSAPLVTFTSAGKGTSIVKVKAGRKPQVVYGE